MGGNLAFLLLSLEVRYLDDFEKLQEPVWLGTQATVLRQMAVLVAPIKPQKFIVIFRLFQERSTGAPQDLLIVDNEWFRGILRAPPPDLLTLGASLAIPIWFEPGDQDRKVQSFFSVSSTSLAFRITSASSARTLPGICSTMLALRMV